MIRALRLALELAITIAGFAVVWLAFLTLWAAFQ
jgi:hypothetical protein